MSIADKLSENTTLLLEHDIDISSRTLYLVDDMSEGTVGHLVKGLKHLCKLDDSLPVNLHISSPGGDVGQMFHLYDIIRSTSTPIHTFGYGVVASAAVPILASGDKRYGAPYMKVMIHQASQWMPEGYMNEQVSMALAGHMFQKEMFNILDKHTKKSAAFLEKVSVDKGQVWIDAVKAKEWGIIDEILPPVTRKKTPVKRRVVKKK